MLTQNVTLYDVICRNARIYGDRDAIVFNDVRLTYRQFRERCDQLAAGLVTMGVEKGDRLGIVAHNSDEFMILYGAAAKIGAILLPVNWRFQQNEMEYVLKDGAPKLVFAGHEYHKTVQKIAGKMDTVKRYYIIGGENAPEGFLPFSKLYSEEGSDAQFLIPADSGFVIIHTAAVAGEPRGALLSQSNVIHCNLQMIISNHLGPDDCHICILPLFHIAALSMTMATLHAGGKNAIVERFDPELTLKLIEKEKGTGFFHFPPILQMILDKHDETDGSYVARSCYVVCFYFASSWWEEPL
jgi:acyl-CoA synthetase (AMP-forming)/AMP-acid ligase II